MLTKKTNQTKRIFKAHYIALTTILTSMMLMLLGCAGETEIILTTDKEAISAGGIEFARITAKAILAGSPVASGTKIKFETTAGSFEESSQVKSATLSASGDGEATVSLFSGPSEGTATVTASFSDTETRLSATSSLSIQFTAPTGEKMPVDGTFRMTCDAVNIGALREPVPDIRLNCTLSAQTRKNQVIPATALDPSFLTEAGSITSEKDSKGQMKFTFSPRGGASAPRDVPPDQSLNEPSYFDKSGKQRNPRDGLVTLIAVIDGEESFTDANGNGEYDSGEPFLDSAEPFVDANDNDTHDADEPYIDANKNGQWDLANGQWDASTKIMAIYKLLWTGKLDNSAETSRIERQSTTIVDGGKLELTAYALDLNLNPLAAFQNNNDMMQWELSSKGDASSDDKPSQPMSNAYGFSFDKAANTERKRWKILTNSFTANPYTFTVGDKNPGDKNPPSTFTVSVKVVVTPGQTASGSFLPKMTELFSDKVEGSCD